MTEHFTKAEMMHSDTASIKHIKNTTNDQTVLNNLKELCVNILEPIREYVKTPIIITSGYRSPAVNKAVGGAKNSQHMSGQAADFIVKGWSKGQMEDLFHWIINSDLKFDQVISEGIVDKGPNTGFRRNVPWIHISYGPRNRRQVLYN